MLQVLLPIAALPWVAQKLVYGEAVGPATGSSATTVRATAARYYALAGLLAVYAWLPLSFGALIFMPRRKKTSAS